MAGRDREKPLSSANMSWGRGGKGVGPRQRRLSMAGKRMREKLVLAPSGWLSQRKGLPKAGQMGVSGPSRAPGPVRTERAQKGEKQSKVRRENRGGITPEVCLHPGSSARTGALRSNRGDPGV